MQGILAFLGAESRDIIQLGLASTSSLKQCRDFVQSALARWMQQQPDEEAAVRELLAERQRWRLRKQRQQQQQQQLQDRN